MADFVQSLVDMGFARDQALMAVEATGNSGVEAAMDWILAQAIEPETTQMSEPQQEEASSDQASSESTQSALPEGVDVVRSYKCDDCTKQFENAELMEYHAFVTNHTNFSESTEEKRALTEEEKQAQMKRIEEKLKQKRTEREEKWKKEEIKREKNGTPSGKELAVEKMQLIEKKMEDVAKVLKQEAVEDCLARERAKAQIKADNAARKAKYAAAAGGGGSGGTTEPGASSSSLQSQQSLTNFSELASPPKKDCKETKLQLRLPNGKTLTQTFGCNEPLSTVRLYVERNRTDGLTGDFKLMTSFPGKVYEGDDYDLPLETLGLVPSAVLMVTKPA